MLGGYISGYIYSWRSNDIILSLIDLKCVRVILIKADWITEYFEKLLIDIYIHVQMPFMI